MTTITIDRSRCKKDGMCTVVCPAHIFSRREELAIPEVAHVQFCIACGQCVAICPQNAISHSAVPVDSVSPIQFERMPTAEQVTELLRARRSIRAFREKPVERDKVEQIIDGARFAPSGHNSQSTEFRVIQDRAVLAQVSATVIGYIKFEVSRLNNPLFRSVALLADRELAEQGLSEIPTYKRMIRGYEGGADPILWRAPVLLVFHARRAIGLADVNTLLALQNASLVAHSLGIGNFYSGWIAATCRAPLARVWRQRIHSVMGIPPQNRVHGTLALGYPVPRFERWIERKPARVTWA